MPRLRSIQVTHRPLSREAARLRSRRPFRTLCICSLGVADSAPAALFLEQFLLARSLRYLYILHDLAGDHLGDGRASPLGVVLLLELLAFEEQLPLGRGLRS